PPFEPTVRDGNVFARGACDNKGQFMTHVKSVETWLAVEGRLPVNIKLLIEGEEEVGSGHLEEYVRQNTKRLACDCVVVSDTCQFGPGRPAITCGLRGVTYYDLKLTGPKRDLHSGSFGGSVINPAVALAKMISALIDDRGRVQVPGFYDDVVPLTDEERRQFASLPFDEKTYMKETGVDALGGEEGFTTLERRWARPTFDICGLTSGYQGEGAKTVLPSTASAKLSFRLVPDQDPDKITAGLRKILTENCPPGIKMELVEHQGSPGMMASLDSPYVKAAARAIEYAFDVPPVYIREGGSIPIVATFAHELDADVLLLGWAQDDDNAHSPNEKFSLDSYHRATRTSAKLWEELGRL
ncbi:MAG: M20/M25/M40 family metallo-hydrolase, partial [Pirellulales bacterium]|nr:M20/M25/M40 family metallo-hydrolase [Pirellulales bacterium]